MSVGLGWFRVVDVWGVFRHYDDVIQRSYRDYVGFFGRVGGIGMIPGLGKHSTT